MFISLQQFLGNNIHHFVRLFTYFVCPYILVA